MVLSATIITVIRKSLFFIGAVQQRYIIYMSLEPVCHQLFIFLLCCSAVAALPGLAEGASASGSSAASAESAVRQ